MTADDVAAKKTPSLPDRDAEPWQRMESKFFAAALFLVSALIFSFLRSKDIFGVDGAFRCLEVYRRHSIFFHENNHMLYPVNVLAWTRLLGAVGLTSGTRPSFYSRVELMNCLAAAASLTMVVCLTKLATRSTRVALCVGAGLGFSKAFLLHATNSAEPMVGIFWSFLAICLAALSFKTQHKWPIIASGFLFVLAMATYQSTIFLAPAAMVLIWYGRAPEQGQSFFSGPRVALLSQFALGGLAGCLSIYGWVFWRLGINRPSEMLRRFFVQQASRVYQGQGVGKLLNLPIGLVRNAFPLQPRYTGIRNLLAGPWLSTILFLLIVAAVSVFAVVHAALVVQKWGRVPAIQRTAFLAAGAGFLFSSVPLVLMDPNYDKLWLQPLACLAVLLGISISLITPNERNSFLLSKVMPAFLLAGVLSNIVWAAKSHATETSDVGETERLAHILGKNDLLVGEWDHLTTLYGYGWAGAQVFSFPTEAVVHGASSVQLLHEKVAETRKAGGQIYFLALLDVSPEVWDSYLGSRCGVPYSELDFYRAHSAARIATFQNGPGSSVVLRRLDLPE